MELTTLTHAFNPMTAQLVRAQLEAAGFVVFVEGELAALSTDGYGLGVGGIRVRVPADQANAARAYLAATPVADETDAPQSPD